MRYVANLKNDAQKLLVIRALDAQKFVTETFKNEAKPHFSNYPDIQTIQIDTAIKRFNTWSSITAENPLFHNQPKVNISQLIKFIYG